MGSFYLVLATRSCKNESIIKPASHCDNCNKKLSWYELIPVISYIVQGGKCRKCHNKVSIINLIVELLTGLLFGLGFYLYGFTYEFFAFLIISSLTIIIFISDFKYLVILDYPLFICVILILVLKFIYFGFKPFMFALLSGVAILLFLLLIKIIGDKVFKRESLGWGDVKLALFIGSVLGLKLGLTAFVLGSIFALPYASFYIIKKQEKEIPYGPFLIFAVFIIFIFMDRISDLINYLFVIQV